MVRFLTFEKVNKGRDRAQIGSTRLRVHNLIKYWPDAGLYKYGENPDVLVFQKVFVTEDYRFPEYFEGIKILDICDPAWFEGSLIKATVDVMDAVVAPSQALVDFIKQLTDKPVKLIKDRFDLSQFPKPKVHSGQLKTVAWFGYAQNAELLQYIMPTLERLDLNLIVISNQDPMPYRWCRHDEAKYKANNYTYKKYVDDTVYSYLQQADVVAFPQGDRPEDRFKSENKTVIANLLGLPVIKNIEDLEHFTDPENRNRFVTDNYDKLKAEYDCRVSVDEYKKLIQELKS